MVCAKTRQDKTIQGQTRERGIERWGDGLETKQDKAKGNIKDKARQRQNGGGIRDDLNQTHDKDMAPITSTHMDDLCQDKTRHAKTRQDKREREREMGRRTRDNTRHG
jgi:hypothetical protein